MLSRDAELQSQLRQLWKEWLEAQDLSEPGLLEVPLEQPLHLRLLRAMLEAAGDPDREFLRQAEDGPVGILDPLPRTPHVFEEQLKRSVGGLASVGSQLRLGRGAGSSLRPSSKRTSRRG